MRALLKAGFVIGAAVLPLAGCDDLLASFGDDGAADPEVIVAAPPENSDALVEYYARAERDLIASGRMRTDVAPEDADFTIDSLVDDFVHIALYDEFAVNNSRFVAQQRPSRLRRWQQPIRVGLVFGPSVDDKQVQQDLRGVRSYARRLASATGHPVTVTDGSDANLTVLFLNRSEQQMLGHDLTLTQPDLPAELIDGLVNSPREAFCNAYTLADADNPDSYDLAFILIKAEQRGLMRVSCIHEEMAQAMGLPNDSPDARPSIFNDDEEFALLTRHDEVLLRMLYDGRLHPGMTEEEARPLLRAIAEDAVAATGTGNLLAKPSG